MAPKKSALDRLFNPGKAERDIWKVGRDERVAVSNKEAALGRPSVDRMVLKYDDQKFNEKKSSARLNTTREWERTHLKDLNKSYGKSMDKKFKKWALEQGVPEQDHFQFRTWMDANEHVVKGTGGAKDSKLRSDGYKNVEGQKEINASTASARNATAKRQEEAKIARKKEQEARLLAEKPKTDLLSKVAKDSKVQKKNKNVLQDALDVVKGTAKAVNPFDDKSFGEAMLDQATQAKAKRSDASNEIERQANRSMNSTTLGLKANLGKKVFGESPEYMSQRDFGEGGGKDILGDLSGYLVPGIAAVKGARAAGVGAKGLTKGASWRNTGQYAKEGALVGAGLSGTEIGVREGLNPDDTNWKENLTYLGINTAAGAALDPLVGMAGPLAKSFAKNTVDKGLNGQGDALTQLMSREIRRSGQGPSSPLLNTGNVSEAILKGQASPTFPQFGGEKLNPLERILPTGPNAPKNARINPDHAMDGQLKELQNNVHQASLSKDKLYQGRTAREWKNDLDTLVAQNAPEASPTQAPSQATLRGESIGNSSPEIVPYAPLKDKIARWQGSKTKINEDDMLEIMDTQYKVDEKIQSFEASTRADMTKRLEAENPVVMEQLQKDRDAMREIANVSEEWKLVKEVQEQWKNPTSRPQWGKFSLPEGYAKMDEFKGLPRMFIDQNSPVGYDNAFEMAGFDSFDSFRLHLENMHSTLNTRLKDISPYTREQSKDIYGRLKATESHFEQRVNEESGLNNMLKLRDDLLALQEREVGTVPAARTITADRDVLGRALKKSDGPAQTALGTDRTIPVPRQDFDRAFKESAATADTTPVKTAKDSTKQLQAKQEASISRLEEAIENGASPEEVRAFSAIVNKHTDELAEVITASKAKESGKHTNIDTFPTDDHGYSLKRVKEPKHTNISPGTVKPPKEVAEEAIQSVDIAADFTPISRDSLRDKSFGKGLNETYSKNIAERMNNAYVQYMVNDRQGLILYERGLKRDLETSLKKQLKENPSDKALQERLDLVQADLKLIKQTGGKTSMAVSNQAASQARASNKIKKYTGALEKIAKDGKVDVSDLINWQMANRIVGLQKKNSDYSVGADVQAWANKISQQKGEHFEAAKAVFRTAQEEDIAMLLKIGKETPESAKALLKEDFYIPLYRDLDYKRASDNISKKKKEGNPITRLMGQKAERRDLLNNTNVRKNDFSTIRDLEEGDVANYYKNPMESFINNQFSLSTSVMKNDAHKQIGELAKIDMELNGGKGMFTELKTSKEYARMSKTEADKFLHYWDGGEEFYVRANDELYRPLIEADIGYGFNALQSATKLYSSMFTRSLEFQATSALRDPVQAFVVASGSPIKTITNIMKELFKENPNLERLGGKFHGAFNAQNASQVNEDFARELSKKYHIDGGKDVKGAAVAIQDALRKVDAVVSYVPKKIGNKSDSLARGAEMTAVQKRFEKDVFPKLDKKIADLEARIAAAPKRDDGFGEGDALAGRLEETVKARSEADLDMEREMTHRATDVLNYKNRGDGSLARALNAYVPFTNVAIQSVDKMRTAFLRDPIGTSMKAVLPALALTHVQGQLVDNLNESDKKDFDNLPAHTKQLRYVFPLGDGKYVSIPKVHEIAAIMNYFEVAKGNMDVEDANALAIEQYTPFQMGRFVKGLLPSRDEEDGFLDKASLPSSLPTIGAELMANKNMTFNKNPISYGYKEDVLGSDGEPLREDGDSGPKIKNPTANPWTSETFKKVFGDTGTADKAQYVARQLGGDYAKYGTAISDLIVGSDDAELRTSNAKKAVNPLQDYYKSGDSDWFQSMFPRKLTAAEKKAEAKAKREEEKYLKSLKN